MKILKITLLLIYILLAANFLAEFVNVLINYRAISFLGIDTFYAIRNTLHFIWERFSFVLVSVAILANYNNPSKMNIDENFLVLYAVSGIVFGAYYFWPAGWLGLVCVGLIMYMLIKKKFNFEQRTTPNPAKMVIILLVAFVFNWLYKITFIGSPVIGQYATFFLMGLPFWLIEEAVNRGILWMNLESFGWRPFWLVLVQALIFWILHVRYVLSEPVLFWLQVPLASIFLTLLVWRYKSIALSSIAHILLNLR